MNNQLEDLVTPYLIESDQLSQLEKEITIDLQNILNGKKQHVQLLLIGSYADKTQLKVSDIDYSLETTNHSNFNRAKSLKHHLENNKKSDVSHVEHKSVSLVSFNLIKYQLHVDITINNSNAIMNKTLFNLLILKYPILRRLIMLLKLFYYTYINRYCIPNVEKPTLPGSHILKFTLLSLYFTKDFSQGFTQGFALKEGVSLNNLYDLTNEVIEYLSNISNLVNIRDLNDGFPFSSTPVSAIKNFCKVFKAITFWFKQDTIPPIHITKDVNTIQGNQQILFSLDSFKDNDLENNENEIIKIYNENENLFVGRKNSHDDRKPPKKTK